MLHADRRVRPWRIALTDLRRLFLQSEELRGRILEFEQEQTLVVSQIAACNRLHEVEARLARWLLMADDQTGSATLDFTQEFLGMMLGTRRTTVNLVAGTLQRSGAIEYTRGKVKVLNRALLEGIACECYKVVSSLNTGLYKKGASEW